MIRTFGVDEGKIHSYRRIHKKLLLMFCFAEYSATPLGCSHGHCLFWRLPSPPVLDLLLFNSTLLWLQIKNSIGNNQQLWNISMSPTLTLLCFSITLVGIYNIVTTKYTKGFCGWVIKLKKWMKNQCNSISHFWWCWQLWEFRVLFYVNNIAGTKVGLLDYFTVFHCNSCWLTSTWHR